VPLPRAAAKRRQMNWLSSAVAIAYVQDTAPPPRSLASPSGKPGAGSRHRSAETFAGYVRAAEEWTDSGLKGVGF
jgi:hypothetical protein